jgi:hypothetical protein
MSAESDPTGDLHSEVLKAMSGTKPLSGKTCPKCGKPVVAILTTEVGVGYVHSVSLRKNGGFSVAKTEFHVVTG